MWICCLPPSILLVPGKEADEAHMSLLPSWDSDGTPGCWLQPNPALAVVSTCDVTSGETISWFLPVTLSSKKISDSKGNDARFKFTSNCSRPWERTYHVCGPTLVNICRVNHKSAIKYFILKIISVVFTFAEKVQYNRKHYEFWGWFDLDPNLSSISKLPWDLG